MFVLMRNPHIEIMAKEATSCKCGKATLFSDGICSDCFGVNAITYGYAKLSEILSNNTEIELDEPK